MNLCSIQNCNMPAYKRGWCRKHHMRWQRHGDPTIILRCDQLSTLEERLWRKVDKSGDCWPWLGAIDSQGYGEFRVLGHTYRTHVVSWIVTNGPVENGLFVCHKCDNRPCCRPDHLFLGTNEDNMRDAAMKGRMPRGERVKNCVLQTSQVLEIKQLLADGLSQAQIARRFRVKAGVIGAIARNETWRHVVLPISLAAELERRWQLDMKGE